MFDAPPDAQLQLERIDQGLSISAWIAVARPRALRWRLELTSRSPGGTSTVSQGGTATSGSSAPVGSIRVSPNSRGSAILRVYDGDHEVARDELSFGDDAVQEP
jgi:hypothetical protein